MARNQEIIDAIREGMERAERTFGSLTDEQLNTKIHEAENGWTAKQILAHLAGRAEGHQMMLAMAEGGAPPSFGGMDVNAWNQSKVDERASMSRDDLLREFREAHERLIARVETLPEDAFARTVTMPRGEMTVGDMLAGSGGRHSVNHTVEVEQALGLADS